MKKFQTHNKWCEEEHPRTQERKKSTAEEARKFSRHGKYFQMLLRDFILNYELVHDFTPYLT